MYEGNGLSAHDCNLLALLSIVTGRFLQELAVLHHSLPRYDLHVRSCTKSHSSMPSSLLSRELWSTQLDFVNFFPVAF